MGEPGNDLLSLEIQPTIIGPEAFHCPVRNGKEWFRNGMVARLKTLEGNDRRFRLRFDSFWKSSSSFDSSRLHGYRIKLHEQLVSVS